MRTSKVSARHDVSAQEDHSILQRRRDNGSAVLLSDDLIVLRQMSIQYMEEKSCNLLRCEGIVLPVEEADREQVLDDQSEVDKGLIAMFIKMSPEERLQANDDMCRLILELRNAYKQQKQKTRSRKLKQNP